VTAEPRATPRGSPEATILAACPQRTSSGEPVRRMSRLSRPETSRCKARSTRVSRRSRTRRDLPGHGGGARAYGVVFEEHARIPLLERVEVDEARDRT